MMPPCLLRVAIIPQGRFGFRLWLPLFLFWPIAVGLLIIVFPLIFIAELVSRIAHWSVSPLQIIPLGYGLICALKGVTVKVDSRYHGPKIDIRIV